MRLFIPNFQTQDFNDVEHIAHARYVKDTLHDGVGIGHRHLASTDHHRLVRRHENAKPGGRDVLEPGKVEQDLRHAVKLNLRLQLRRSVGVETASNLKRQTSAVKFLLYVHLLFPFKPVGFGFSYMIP